MVSKARELFPEPDAPLTTVSLPWGISHEMFFRLWVRAPRITIASFAELNRNAPGMALSRRTQPRISTFQTFAFRGDAGNVRLRNGSKRFDRLRTVLFERLRTQSPDSHY